ncbi:MAG: hypothetical protein ACJ76N_13580 [Thermoanaerobaculia bacterium]
MAPKPPIPPPRPPALHVQAATARAAQAKLPDRVPAPRPSPPLAVPVLAEHVRRALAPAQAKLPQAVAPGRPQASHVRNAVQAVQAMPAAPPRTFRPPAPHVPSPLRQPPPVSRTQPRPPGPVVQRRKILMPPPLGEIETEDYTERELDGFIGRYLMAPGTFGALATLVEALEADEFKKEGAPPPRERGRGSGRGRGRRGRREPPPPSTRILRQRPEAEEREVKEREVKEPRFRAGSNPEWSYPAQPPRRLNARRSGFSAAEGEALLDPLHYAEASVHADVTRFSLHENADSGIGTLRLGISYNHILADSRIRYFYWSAIRRVRDETAGPETRTSVSSAMRGLFQALTADDPELMERADSDWERLSEAKRVDDMAIAPASRIISNAPGNVRPGHAGINTDIGNAFDPELDPRGRYTARTWRIYSAVIRLAHAGGITITDAMDALRPATPRVSASTGYSSTGTGSRHTFERPESSEEARARQAHWHREVRGRSAPRELPQDEAKLQPPRKKKKGT